MIDYQISVRVRVNERHPKEWIVDALYDNLDRKNQEDAFESMQNIDDEVFTTLANKFNLEVD